MVAPTFLKRTIIELGDELKHPTFYSRTSRNSIMGEPSMHQCQVVVCSNLLRMFSTIGSKNRCPPLICRPVIHAYMRHALYQRRAGQAEIVRGTKGGEA